MTDEPRRDTCLECGAAIMWQPSTLGGRWFHGTRPVPDHAAEPTHTIIVSPEAWDVLQRQLAEPPRVLPGLVALYERHGRIKVEPDDPAT